MSKRSPPVGPPGEAPVIATFDPLLSVDPAKVSGTVGAIREDEPVADFDEEAELPPGFAIFDFKDKGIPVIVGLFALPEATDAADAGLPEPRPDGIGSGVGDAFNDNDAGERQQRSRRRTIRTGRTEELEARQRGILENRTRW